jgi:hypothetical protein
MRTAPWRSTLLALPLLGALVLSACGGNKAAPEGGDSGKPPAAAVEATPKADLLDLASITPILPATSPATSDLSLGGAADRIAEAEIAAALQKAGVVAEVFVLPISDTTEWLLIIEVDGAQATAAPQDQSVLLSALAGTKAARAGAITRIAINLRTVIDSKPSVVTLTVPMAAILGVADGKLTQADLESALLIEVAGPASP